MRYIKLGPVLDAAEKQAYYVEKMAALPVAHGDTKAQRLIGWTQAFQKSLALVSRVAPSQATVPLLGESRTGEELRTRAVHEESSRATAALVPADC